jgi:hypothetical protein
MKCISSPALDNAAIISYVEGEVDDAVAVHMKECPFCRERASQWKQLENRLQKQLYRVSCPTPMELGEYHLGLLPEPQVSAIEQHLQECLLCSRELKKLKDFLGAPAPSTNFLAAVKVLVARITGPLENGFSPMAVALRGDTKGPLTFEADDVVITLEVQQEPNGQVSLVGQMAADDQDQWTAAKVELQQADSSQLTASMDDLGAFRFEEVLPGAIQITIKSLSGIHIQIPNIDISV